MKNRTVKILFQLLNINYPIPISDIAKNYNVSSRTIRNDIQSINDFLEKNNFSRIKSARHKGIYFSGSKDEALKAKDILNSKICKSYLTPDERILDILLSISLNDKITFAYQKEVEFEVSKSTIDDDMRQLRSLLKTENLYVTSDLKNGLSIEGDEHLLRSFLVNIIGRKVNSSQSIINIYESVIYKRVICKYIPYDLIKRIYHLHFKMFKESEENIYKFNKILFTVISIIRLQSNHNTLIKGTRYSIGKGLYVRFIQTAFEDVSVNIDDNEVNYLASVLEILSNKTLENSKYWIESQIISLNLYEIIDKSLPLTENNTWSRIQKSLQNHIASLLNRIDTDTQISNPLTDEIKKEYKKIFLIIKNYFNNTLNKNITEDEAAYLTTYFSLISNKNRINNTFFKAAVLCNYGMATGYLIKDKLENLFDVRVVKVCGTDRINDAENAADLIFSTVNFKSNKVPTMIIDPLFSDHMVNQIEAFLARHNDLRRLDYEKNKLFKGILGVLESNNVPITIDIMNELYELFKISNVELNIKEFKPMIRDVLTDDNILLNIEVNDWRDSIIKVAQPLLRKEVITQEYIDNMIKAVDDYGPYIVIAPQIALAHARPEDGANQLGLSVATLNNPIEFGNEANDPVKLIFCLAAVDSYSHLEIMKEIVHLMDDNDKLDKLIKAEHIDAFKELLF